MEEYRISLEAVRERKGDIQKNLGMGGGEGGRTRSMENQYFRDRLWGSGGRWDESHKKVWRSIQRAYKNHKESKNCCKGLSL